MDTGETDMKMIQMISASLLLLVASANVLAHPGHAAIGDVLHVEYLFAAVIVGAIALITRNRVKERR
jgi:hypothetical protein